MNQAIKENVYGLGNDRQVEFMAELGGMNDIERKAFKMLHNGDTDLAIMMDLNCDRNAYASIEKSVRTKLLLAVFDCINKAMHE